MKNRFLAWAFFAICAAAAAPARADGSLTEIEARWLQGAWPVITYARQSGLALDIVVQPQAAPGAAPLALAFVDGRCKLVLSMRGNPQGQEALARIAPELQDAALELMAAHELGHCRRYLDGAWFALPPGFSAGMPATLSADLQAAVAAMAAARREEAYGDLVGLAWTRQRHPLQYAAVHAWLLAERSADHVPGSPHDTLAWVRLAVDGRALDQPSIFAASATLWEAGLTADP